LFTDGTLAAIAANNAACLIVKRSTLQNAGDFWESGEAFERSSDGSHDDEGKSDVEYDSHEDEDGDEDGEENEDEMGDEKVQHSKRYLDLQEATRLFTAAHEWFKERGRQKERLVISGNLDSISRFKN